MADVQPKTFGERLQSLNKSTLYSVLIAVVSVPLFMSPIKVPDKPEESSLDLYAALMALPENSTVLLASDWTLSTRGESGGQFEAIMRIFMRRHIKTAIYTSADPQAPQVARDEIALLNRQAVAAGQKTYDRWTDYVVLGFFPNAEGTANSIATNVQSAFMGRRETALDGTLTDVFQSPVLKDIKVATDFKLVIVNTASSTSTITIERLAGKVKLAMLVTGVMGPETQVYYASGQLVGLAKGLKGDYDLEYMMENGVNFPDYNHAAVQWDKHRDLTIPGFPGKTNLGQGATYISTLQFAFLLLILSVAIGNIGMVLSKRRAA